MPKGTRITRTALILILIFSSICFAANALDYQTAFYYGNHPPLKQLKSYHRVVFDPNSGIDPRAFDSKNNQAFAYVSLGEISADDKNVHSIPDAWIIGKNKTWQSLVLDQANPAWQKYFIDQIIMPLWNKGYTGFFLDTLDSYRLADMQPADSERQQKGLIAIILAIKQKYPNAKIILNRGFELLPYLKNQVEAVAAESLFAGWDNAARQYVPVSEGERKILLAELKSVQQMGIPVIVIDYLPPGHLKEARQIAQKISQLGFSPWITNHNLTAIYSLQAPTILRVPVSLKTTSHALPRKILVFYNGKINDIDDKLDSLAVTKIAMPLNYLGYVPIFRNINEPLPSISKNEYAGIVVADIGIVLGKEQQIRDWYLQQIRHGIPLVILNDFGFTLNTRRLAPFNLDYSLFPNRARTVVVSHQTSIAGYEISPILKPEDFVPIRVKQGTPLLTVANEFGRKGDMAAITRWGGYALFPLVLQSTDENSTRWVINPFDFFKRALHLPDMPIPDTTTENGRRLMLAHIDGDSFANKGKWYQGPFVGEILKQEILERYNVPTTVSIIQGEVGPDGLYPQLSPDLEKIANQIFALPNVEIASHTYSHPFNWEKAGQYRGDKPNPYSLPIPHYHLNIDREITGSVNYINQYLAPPGKKTKVFLWSGEADVPEKAVALTYQLGLSNMNGGDTKINKYKNSMTNVSGLGIYQGPYFEVFAPITNDFEMTDSMSKPRYTIVSAIDTFKLTDQPRRLKPIDIYNHFYIVDEISGIKALKIVYDWAVAQPVMNIYVSDYVAKVLDFNNMTITKKGQGWEIITHDKLRELRLPHTLGYPDLVNSLNVIGYNSYNDSYYVHLGPGGRSLLRVTPHPPQVPFIADANARVTYFKRHKNGLNFALEGYMPLKFTLANMKNCQVLSEKQPLTPQSQQHNQQRFELPQGIKNEFSVQCT